jgi:hypothetical protein
MSLYPTIFTSDDLGAPSMAGTAGALVALLDAILVNGYGSGPTARAPLGWTIEYTASNKRVYRGNPTSGSGYYLWVDDTNGRYGLVRAFSSMSDIDNGTDMFPPPATRPNGMLWAKSSLASATARAWWAIGNERCFYLFFDVAGLAGGHSEGPVFFAGDIISNKSGDAHTFALTHTTITGYAGTGELSNMWKTCINIASDPETSNAAIYIARSIAGSAGAVFANTITVAGVQSVPVGNGSMPYPIYAGGPMVYERLSLSEAGRVPRGRMPGVFGHSHPRASFTELSPVAGMLTKNFRVGSSQQGQVFFETDQEWV